jgi:hypothetical protein
MLFEGKFQRARRVQREATGLDKEEEQERRRQQEEEKPEKGDWFAMLFSAFYMLFLPAVGILGAIVALAYLILGLF